ncbi:hypothetical protein BJ322DRAFT_848307 [Thelephora terrestris]|uniref:Uncharacterized protein n=1 Tax=Thelephora terrestris TaxID=56493 RepID=A0A9P6HEX3_9AGAM|nr:hypothetical protein BJ322DRAFT_848307 [Thelephora terrestris]
MLWTQFALSVVMISFGPTSKPTSNSRRPLMLNIAFYGITAVASSGLTVAGIVIHWQFTFANQYLFLQALFVWASYHLMTVIHQTMPNNDRDRDDVEDTIGPNMAGSRATDVVSESTDGKQRSDIIPRNLGRETLKPDVEDIEMYVVVLFPF